MPRPWGETSRSYIENRDEEIVNNKEQYCSVVRTGFGNTIACLGGEVDASMSPLPNPVYLALLLAAMLIPTQSGTPNPRRQEPPSTGLSSRRAPKSTTHPTK